MVRLRLTRSEFHGAQAFDSFDATFSSASTRSGRILRNGHSAGPFRGRAECDATGLCRACCGPSSSTTTWCKTGWRAIRAIRRHPRSARRAGITTGRTCTTPTSSRCRTSGSTRGMPHGIWPFTAFRLRSSIADFAKEQLILLLREWYMHPNGQLPAYEWAFGDVNPPVHAWAAWRVYKIDKKRRGQRGSRVPAARLPQAAAEFHLVGEPQRRRGHEHLSGRISGPGQHRRV